MTGLCYGRCEGGPYHGRNLAHNPGVMPLAVERHKPFRALPGVQASKDPNVGFGAYVFDRETEIWNWKGDRP